MIEIQNVSKSFGEKKAVNNITASIPSGCITGFIGPNGAGKTTTINMMTGVLAPDSGTLSLNGINIEKEPLKAKEQFCLVPDSPDLFLRLTGYEYISFIADMYGVDASVRKNRMESLTREFGIDDVLGQQINSYSHGMRQKVIICAALVCSPSIWILDEPMTGLDPSASFLLKEKMRQHAAEGNTVFFSTHVLEVAEKLCDKILLIDHGNILFDGSLDELKEKHPGLSLEEIFIKETGHEQSLAAD